MECLFGEIDGRWGIFWSPLQFSLEHNIQVIDAAFRLHNYIVDYNIAHGLHRNLQAMIDQYDHEELLVFAMTNPDEPIGPIGDNLNDDSAVLGRPPQIERELREEGVAMRQQLKSRIH